MAIQSRLSPLPEEQLSELRAPFSETFSVAPEVTLTTRFSVDSKSRARQPCPKAWCVLQIRYALGASSDRAGYSLHCLLVAVPG